MTMLDSLALVLALSSVGGIPTEPTGVGETVLIDFAATWCGPCRSMQPTIERLSGAGYPIRQVDIDQNPALAARYQVTSVPCFVMIVDGREVDRVVGMTSYGRLEQMLARARVEPPGRQEAVRLAQSPDGLRQAPPKPSTTSIVGRSPRAVAPSTPTRASKAQLDDLIASTVRVKVDDEGGHSYGTGTIIDVRADEALVLTCGHLFRDSQGKGAISINLFGADGPKTVSGRLISYDLSRDLGLVSIRPGVPVRASRIAPKGHPIARGNRVISLGCDNGEKPTVRQTHVTAIDRYDGPPNIEAAGMPVEGRSGGGLFDSQGHLIGVCFAADSRDNEGLYAGLASIQAELDRLGLADVYTPPEAATDIVAQAASPTMPKGPSMSKGQIMPKRMPVVSAAPRNHEVPVRQVSSSPRPRGAKASSVRLSSHELSSHEVAALAEIQSRSHGAEVICIIRPNDPDGKSEIIVLSDVSPEFIQQLTRAQPSGGTRQLTSMEVPERAHSRGTSSRGTSSRGAMAMPVRQARAIDWRGQLQ